MITSYRVTWQVVHMCRPGSLDPGAQPSVIATLDLSTINYYNRLLLFNVLNTALNSGYLDMMRVSPNGFSFRPITGLHGVNSLHRQCQCQCQSINLS